MTRRLMISFNNAEPGKDEAFNDWYDNQHVPDILRIRHFEAAQRFRIEADASSPDFPYSYMTIYEVESDTIEEATAALAEKRGTPEMVLTDTMAQKRVRLWVEPLPAGRQVKAK
jgi:hypothetical protein